MSRTCNSCNLTSSYIYVQYHALNYVLTFWILIKSGHGRIDPRNKLQNTSHLVSIKCAYLASTFSRTFLTLNKSIPKSHSDTESILGHSTVLEDDGDEL